LRIIFSPRKMNNGVVEIVSRDKSYKESVALDSAIDTAVNYVKKALDDLK